MCAHSTDPDTLDLRPGDALVIVDVQNDFLPGGALAVPRGDAVVPVLNAYARRFAAAGLPIYATRDWHPPDHCSFQAQGGMWPAHCVAGSPGADFAVGLELPPSAAIVSKATHAEHDAYSALDGTDLARRLHAHGVTRLFVGGLATDYCVLATVRDAIEGGFAVVLLRDAVQAVERHAGDGERAIEEMQGFGARGITLDALAAA